MRNSITGVHHKDRGRQLVIKSGKSLLRHMQTISQLEPLEEWFESTIESVLKSDSQGRRSSVASKMTRLGKKGEADMKVSRKKSKGGGGGGGWKKKRKWGKRK